jgi:colanic acid/amylovoran biosynthesis protein
MRILFDPAAHDMRNKGNNALLQSAMQRLRKFWPDASLEVLTFAPRLLQMYYPYAIPVNPNGLQRAQSRLDKYRRLVPQFFWWILFELREEMWHRRYAKLANSVHASVASDSGQKKGWEAISPKPELVNAISKYDLYVASGGGYLTDSDRSLLMDVFDRLEAAIAAGVSTVMVGQGVGPMKDAELLARAQAILPSVDLILYRNQRNGLPLLRSFSILPERIFLTGDDAVEIAYDARQQSIGQGIGFSLRVAHYTQVEEKHIDILRQVLHKTAKSYKAQLIAVPISSAHHESDITHIKQILKGYDRVSVGWRKLDMPIETIHKVSKCRLVVTGTYHGAIFALAQGIPVVGIARSTEYFDKLSELCDEFPGGIQVVRLDDTLLAEKLSATIENAWQSAEEIRPSLLGSARRQIESQHAAYQHIYELMNQKSKKRQMERNG